MRILRAALAGLGALVLGAAGAAAQSWPTRPVTLVVPFTAGTTSDIVARALGEQLAKAIGQPVTIDNRGGAGGNIGAAAVAKAAPDGYTLLLATTGQAATNQLMYKEIGFDPQRDFAPIVLIGKAPVIIAAKLDGPARTLPEAIAYAKANPDKLTAGFPGNGTLGHITGVLLQQRTGIRFAQAQYRGTQQILTDLLGGHIDLAMDSMAAYVPNVQEGEAEGAGARKLETLAEPA
jgi:tripartite-type tricarboxylate transporter receptor subunit TctC